jgi:protein required for attachment to host cells
MAKAWVVVANGSRARVFEADSPKGGFTREVATLVHTQSRLLEQGLTTDLPGRTFDSVGQGRHSLEVRTRAKRHEKENFAAEIADVLDRACAAGKFHHLILAATPAFMGMLRRRLGPHSSRRIVHTVEKDLTRYPPARIRSQLPDKLWMLYG